MSAPHRPTLSRVAKHAGVSVSTASLAFSANGPISAETRDRVLAAARELDYAGPNPLGRQLRSGRSGIVGVVIGDQLKRSFRDPVAVQVLDGLVSTLGAAGLGVLLIPGIPGSDADSRAVDPLIESAAMDVGVLVWGVRSDDPTLAAFQRRDLPVVVGEGRPVPGAPLVSIADRQGTADVVRHLVNLGHTAIAEIALPLDHTRRSGPVDATRLAEADRTPTSNRLAGVRDVVDPVITWEPAGPLVEHGKDAAHAILSGPTRPTAIVAHSDLLAAGALLAAQERGLQVPGDLSVVGFDGLDLPWLAPAVLTTVRQPLAEKGARIGDAVVAIVRGESPQSLDLPVELVVGTTSGPPATR